MDDETLSLCKEVYKATFWEMSEWEFGGVPLYTSDYLLGKLKEYFTYENEIDFGVYYLREINEWEALVQDKGASTADTPLKALLKLTLALHEAGELERSGENE